MILVYLFLICIVVIVGESIILDLTEELTKQKQHDEKSKNFQKLHDSWRNK